MNVQRYKWKLEYKNEINIETGNQNKTKELDFFFFFFYVLYMNGNNGVFYLIMKSLSSILNVNAERRKLG